MSAPSDLDVSLSRPTADSKFVVTLQPEDGGTRVVLRHHDLPDDKQAEHHERGWEFYLGRLELRARGEDPGPDPNT